MCNAAASSMAALKQPTIRVVAIDRMCTGKQQGCHWPSYCWRLVTLLEQLIILFTASYTGLDLLVLSPNLYNGQPPVVYKLLNHQKR
ncbi:hypothetical protein ACFXTO_036234 [Malus domestica]